MTPIHADDIAGRVAVIIGAARGIGLTLTRTLAAQGARVVLADRDHTRALAEAAALPDALGLAVDIADTASVSALRAAGWYAGLRGSHPCAGREIGRLEAWGPAAKTRTMSPPSRGGPATMPRCILSRSSRPMPNRSAPARCGSFMNCWTLRKTPTA